MRARLLAAMPGLKERAKTLIELIDGAYYLYAARPLVLDDKAKALLTPAAHRDARQDRGRARKRPRRLELPPHLEAAVRGFAEGRG